MARHRLVQDRRGGIAVEMALILPILLALVSGIVEVGRAALISLKAQHAATALADLATRDETLSAATLGGLFNAAAHILLPFDLGADGVVILSGAGKTGKAAPTIYWQSRGGGTLAVASSVGAQGGTPGLPTSFVLRDDESVVVAEVVVRYRRWLLGLVPEFTIHRTAYYRPRYGTLRSITP